jgi:deoxyribodipyrimidine photo-lyase
LFEPWTLTQAEQIWYNVQLGLDYPLPIIDLKTSYTEAKDRLWGWRKKKEVQEDSGRVLERLSLPKRKRNEI